MKNKKTIILAVVCALSVVVMLIALGIGQKTKVVFEKPSFDAAAVVGTPEVENPTYSPLNAKVYSVALCGQPIVTGNRVQVYFTNPAENEVWLKLRILDSNGNILGESGLIRPGEFVEYVSLNAEITADTEVSMKIMAYEPDTYHSAGGAALQTTLTLK